VERTKRDTSIDSQDVCCHGPDRQHNGTSSWGYRSIYHTL